MHRHLLALFALAFAGSQVFGCSCIGREDVEQARRKADAVILGTVTSIEEVEVSFPGTLTHFPIFIKRYTVRVERSFKHGSAPDTVVIYSGMGGGDCGYRFELNERYVIYGSRDEGKEGRLNAGKPLVGRGIYWTNICMRTTGDHLSEVEALGRLK